MTTASNTPLRIQLVREVRERAKDAGDKVLIAATARIINAYYIGRDKELKNEYALVYSFVD